MVDTHKNEDVHAEYLLVGNCILCTHTYMAETRNSKEVSRPEYYYYSTTVYGMQNPNTSTLNKLQNYSVELSSNVVDEDSHFRKGSQSPARTDIRILRAITKPPSSPHRHRHSSRLLPTH